VVLQAEFTTDLFDSWLDLLDMARTVVASAHDDVQVCLTSTPRILYSLLQDVLGFLDELTVEVDGVPRDATFGVVLAKDELGRLSIILFHSGAVVFALLRQGMRCRAIPARISLL
jgi:hypothetical protein